MGCRRAKSIVLQSQCQVQSVYWKRTYPLECLGLSSLLLAVWALNHHRHVRTDATYNLQERGASQCSSAGSDQDKPCPLQCALLRAQQRWETRRQVPANSHKTSQIPCEITGYVWKISGRTEKLIATYKSCLINVHFTSAKFYILLLSYVNWAAFCTMINRSLNKQILLLEITLSGAVLFLFGEEVFFQLAISAPYYLLFLSSRNDSDVIQDGISY